MVLFNYSTRELTAKIVYYGPGICGKTTNLQFIHENLPGSVRGKMLSLATKTDRTLFFDFLPIDLGEIRGMKTRVQLYTVPGQVFYNETRKLVLKGVDGIVFVADSQETMLGANVESFKNLEENLRAHGMKLAEIPHVIQFNKRDLPKLSGIEDMNAALNKFNAPFYESVATTGIGVQDTLKAIVKLVLLNLTKKYEPKPLAEAAVAATAPAAVAAMASVASAPPSTSRVAAPVAESSVATPPMSKTERSPVPLSTTEAPAASRQSGAATHKDLRKAPPSPVETITSFGEDEIDGLVDEVEEIQAPPADEGAWIGVQPGESEPAFAEESASYGSSVPIEDLLGDKSQSPVPEPVAEAEWQPATSSGPGFEVDRGFDPDWGDPAAPPQSPVAASAAASPRGRGREGASAPSTPAGLPAIGVASGPLSEVLLTEVASDEDLFSDPSLEIARLADGEVREILVPVLLGEGSAARRYKLSIRLRLDPIG